VRVDWTDYKVLCDSPDVVSRWMLTQTLELLALEEGQDALHRALAAVLRASPLPKPADHRGGPATDMFRLDLTLEDAGAVAALVLRAAAAGRTTTGTAGRGLGGFAEAWHELAEHLRQRTPPEAGCDVPTRP
jgi:hypothetical protein